MHRIHRICICVVAAIFILSCSGTAWGVQTEGTQANPLAWKFKVGDAYSLLFDQLSQTETLVLEREVKIKVRVKMQVSWTVDKVVDGNASIKQVIHWVTITTTNTDPEGEVKTIAIDTREDPSDDLPSRTKKVIRDMLKDMRPIVGATSFFELSPRGQIGKFTIPKETQQALRDASSSMHLRQVFSTEGMNSILGPSAIEFPEKPVSEVQSWESTRKIENPIGKFDQSFKYEFDAEKSAKEKVAVVNVVSETTKTEDGKEKIEITSQSGKGEIQFDSELGFMKASSFETNVETKKSIRPDIDIITKTRDEVMIEVEKK